MIRSFITRDLNDTMSIWLESSIASHPFIESSYFVKNYEKFMREQLLENKSFVYELDGKIVGFISVKENMVIAALNVAKEYQKKRIGEKLLDYAIEKYQQLSVEVYRENKEASEFFTDNGFVVLGLNMDDENQQELQVMMYSQEPSNRN